MASCPAYLAAFFGRFVLLVRPTAKRLGIDEDYLLTLAAHEHNWSGAHNDCLHNLFGTTHAGGNNLAYESDEEAVQSWETHYGGGVRGSKSLTDFVARLRAIGYNSNDPDYDHKMAQTYSAVVSHKAACGVK
ncbi:MAG: hypothetical protein ACRYG8_54035 [Janthinobacterium lividum]